MKQQRTTVVFNIKWKQALQSYPIDIRVAVYEAVMDYALTGEIPMLSPEEMMAFNFIKQEVDVNNEKFEDTKRKKQEAGRKGGEQTQAKRSKTKQIKQIKANKANQAENENENENEIIATNVAENNVLSSNENKTKEKNILKNIQKENSSLSFDAIINQALSDNEKSWHDALLQKYGIKNLEQAIEDYKMHIELYPRQEPITSLSEFKRHFANIANNYPNFISEKAKQYKPVPIAVEFEQNGKRYVRQFGLEVLLPDNAPAKPTDSVSYYWDDTSLYWRRYG